jgi:hypothetical protein
MTERAVGSTEPKSFADVSWELDLAAAKSIRYHAYRRSFWQSLDHACKVLSIFTGTAVVVSVLNSGTMSVILAIFVEIFSTADVVFSFGDRVNSYDKLYRDWSDLRQQVILIKKDDCEALIKMKARRIEIEQSEPSIIPSLWLSKQPAEFAGG